MISVNERSRLPMTWKALDAQNVLLTPSAVEYSIKCESTGTDLVGATSVDPTAIVTLIIPASVNAIINRANDAELKTLTVTTDKGTDNEINFDYTWRVRNMFGVS